ncbi:carboxypeptidase inhibitor SmCI-like [Podarcis lilfordi]|uniref:Carboxypeptidase inhibitor SmCI-like n=1 Tax=Podarcis lilfordi TaxID=74358 RepID=A0AA35LGE5_9SAUR|nr:carboxypeptidase inhibitor SmCI-like [Podarcis lilfordi]
MKCNNTAFLVLIMGLLAPCAKAQYFFPRSEETMPRKCTLTPKYGKCSSSLPHFYYDAKSNMCRKFIYSGCGGNGNNFQYYYQCVLKCQQFDPPPKCKQPLILGDCKASKRRYYYDAERKRCFVFIYSGCGSNGNNFDSFRECYEECEKYETPEHLINPDKLEDFLRDYCDQPLDGTGITLRQKMNAFGHVQPMHLISDLARGRASKQATIHYHLIGSFGTTAPEETRMHIPKKRCLHLKASFLHACQ